MRAVVRASASIQGEKANANNGEGVGDEMPLKWKAIVDEGLGYHCRGSPHIGGA